MSLLGRTTGEGGKDAPFTKYSKSRRYSLLHKNEWMDATAVCANLVLSRSCSDKFSLACDTFIRVKDFSRFCCHNIICYSLSLSYCMQK